MEYLISRYNNATTEHERLIIEILEEYIQDYEHNQYDEMEVLKRCNNQSVTTMDQIDEIVKEYFEAE